MSLTGFTSLFANVSLKSGNVCFFISKKKKRKRKEEWKTVVKKCQVNDTTEAEDPVFNSVLFTQRQITAVSHLKAPDKVLMSGYLTGHLIFHI